MRRKKQLGYCDFDKLSRRLQREVRSFYAGCTRGFSDFETDEFFAVRQFWVTRSGHFSWVKGCIVTGIQSPPPPRDCSDFDVTVLAILRRCGIEPQDGLLIDSIVQANEVGWRGRWADDGGRSL
jgi:hypothetical protein